MNPINYDDTSIDFDDLTPEERLVYLKAAQRLRYEAELRDANDTLVK